ncbi:MAG TPA: hypothetical protein VK569_03545 [Bacteroidota bacterium]|nr:hypothetical protein [Bacteroidota bacterium]
MKHPGSGDSQGVTSSVLVPVFAGIILLECYACVALRHRFFLLPDFRYFSRGDLLMLFYLPESHLSSILWKLFLLLPATVLISIGVARSRFRMTLPGAARERLIVGSLLMLATVLLYFSVRFLFRETEVTDDENVYDFQAQTLLSGRIANPGCPASKCFDNVFLINTESVREGKYTLGHPAVIALGMALGDRYIGIVALSALTVLLLHRICLELYADRSLALLVACLMCVSPFFYLMSSSRLSHTTSAFFLSLFMYLFLRVRRSEVRTARVLLALCAGLALGYAFNVRQLTALGFAVPFCVAGIAGLRTAARGQREAMIVMVAGFAACFALTLMMNHALTGDALLFPFNYYDKSEHLGFGIQSHNFSGGVYNLSVNLLRLNAFLFGFPASLMFLLPVLMTRRDSGDRLLLGIFGSIAAAYMFYYHPGVSDLGPVYCYEMIIPAILLCGRGIMILHRFAAAHLSRGERFVPIFLVVSFLLAVVTFFPERAVHIARLTAQIRKPYELVDSLRLHNAVVIMQSVANKGFVYGYRNASPDFRDDVIYCKAADSSSNAALAHAFPDRNFYLMRYDIEDARYSVSGVDRKELSP